MPPPADLLVIVLVIEFWYWVIKDGVAPVISKVAKVSFSISKTMTIFVPSGLNFILRIFDIYYDDDPKV
jgi:hypothetical protein